MNHDECTFQDEILTLCKDTSEIKATITGLDKRINGSIDSIKQHIRDGSVWRTLIVSVGLAVIINVVCVAYMYGQLAKQVEVNCEILEKFVSKTHEEVNL